MFFPKCKNCCYRCGGISPVRATDDMTQPVGQRNGQLFTEPVAAAEGIADIDDTEEIVAEVDEERVAKMHLAQEVSNKLSRALLTPLVTPAEQKVVTVDESGAQKMETYRKILPVAKTEAMTQPVGVDEEGHLYTPSGGGTGHLYEHHLVVAYQGDDLATDNRLTCTIISASSAEMNKVALEGYISSIGGSLMTAAGFAAVTDAGHEPVYGVRYGVSGYEVLTTEDMEYTIDFDTVTDRVKQIF